MAVEPRKRQKQVDYMLVAEDAEAFAEDSEVIEVEFEEVQEKK